MVKVKNIVLSIFLLGSLVPQSIGAKGKITKSFKLVASAISFHMILKVLKCTKNSYHQIAGDQFKGGVTYIDGIKIERDSRGAIVNLHDGKRVPLALGTIPYKKEHVSRLKKSFGLSSVDQIGVYTLNKKFECNWSGLSKLVKKDETIKWFWYPTVDMTEPSFIDLLRVVRDLEKRDNSDQLLAYIHCRAGRGRSARSVAAYLLHLFYKAGVDVSVDHVVQYLCARRQQVNINGYSALLHFHAQLKSAGGLDQLCELYKDDLAIRDKKCA